MKASGKFKGVFNLPDVLGVIGLGLLSYGLAMIYIPLSLIVTGALFIACAVTSAKHKKTS